MSNNGKPARWWIGTIPYTNQPDLNNRSDWNSNFSYICGQQEIGQSGYHHWQIYVNLKKPQRLSWLKRELDPTGHFEPTKSKLAKEYCSKKDTAVEGSWFEYGTIPIDRSDGKDWDKIAEDARAGRLDQIPSDIYVRCYSQIKRIMADNLQPIAIERQCYVYWGATGTGKSRRAWTEAGLDAYPKDPRTKFWDGYQGHLNVVIDEFRGGIDIAHMLRWLDRYPVVVEVKGSATVLKATNIWITSNLDPRLWYPECDKDTIQALLRRLTIIHFPSLNYPST